MEAWVRDILRCPQCGGVLADDADALRCETPSCGLVYRIEDGIPVLLVDEATRPTGGDPAGADPELTPPAGPGDGTD